MTREATIIGGGLAGSTAGALLARKGWKVLIIEKKARFEQKVCGEFLSPSVWPYFEKLGVTEKVRGQNGSSIKTFSFHTSQAKAVTVSETSGYALSRQRLDTLMLQNAQEAGCNLIMGRTAFPKEITSGLVVIASGRAPHPALSPQAGRGEMNEDPFAPCKGERVRVRGYDRIGFKAHFDGPALDGTLKLFFLDGVYFGITEIEEGRSNLCGIVTKERFKQANTNFDQLLKEAAARNPAFQEWLGEATRISPWSSCSPLVHGPSRSSKDYFYLGDAHGFIEPFFGQGMTSAIASGFLLAKSLESFDSPAEALRDFEERMHQLNRFRFMSGQFMNFFSMSEKRAAALLRTLSTFPFLLSSFMQKVFAFPYDL